MEGSWPLNVKPYPLTFLWVFCVYSSSSKWKKKLFWSLSPDVMGCSHPSGKMLTALSYMLVTTPISVTCHANMSAWYTVERWTAAPNFTLYSPLAATGGTGAHTSTTDASVFRRLQRNCLNSLKPCLHCWMCWSFHWILLAATFGQHYKHLLYGIR